MSLFGDIGVATRNGLKGMIKARERSMRGHVYANMLNMDDETLSRLGLKREDIKKHATSPINFF